MGRYRQALDDFNKAIALNPRDAYGYYNRGLTYEKLGLYSPAIADFTRAILLKSDDINAYNNRGIVYARMGQLDRAVGDFSTAIAIKASLLTGLRQQKHRAFCARQKQSGMFRCSQGLQVGKLLGAAISGGKKVVSVIRKFKFRSHLLKRYQN